MSDSASNNGARERIDASRIPSIDEPEAEPTASAPQADAAAGGAAGAVASSAADGGTAAGGASAEPSWVVDVPDDRSATAPSAAVTSDDAGYEYSRQGEGEYGQPARTPYVRQRAPHRTQGVIDDLANDGTSRSTYTHESNVAVGGGAFSGGASYRRSRKNHSQIKRGRGQYGQYLEIPKGRRSIFASRERKRRRNSILALLFVLVILTAVAWLIWNMMNAITPA